MATPSQKSPSLEEFLETNFGRTTSTKRDVCVSCNGPATEFKDGLSRREYTISGLCQRCQDSVFGDEAHLDFD